MAQGRLHGHAGRHPVVDDDHGAARGLDRRPQARVLAPALLDGGQLARGCRGDVVLAQVERAHQRVVEHDLGLVAVGDGADRELRLPRRADLAHEGDVERGCERARDLGRHRHAAARQGEHEGVLQPHGREPLGQQPAGLGPIRKSYSFGAWRCWPQRQRLPRRPTDDPAVVRTGASLAPQPAAVMRVGSRRQPFLPSFLSPLSRRRAPRRRRARRPGPAPAAPSRPSRCGRRG